MFFKLIIGASSGVALRGECGRTVRAINPLGEAKRSVVAVAEVIVAIVKKKLLLREV